jgi:hypothetical protein
MTIRLTPLLPSQVVGKITSRAPTKECIESEVEEAAAIADNLAKSVDTAKGNFDKKKAAATEKTVYDQEDDEFEKVKKIKNDKLRESAAGGGDPNMVRRPTKPQTDFDKKAHAEKREHDRKKLEKDQERWKANAAKKTTSTTEEITPTTANGVSMPMFREMMKNTERALRLTEEPKSLTKGDLRALVKEEYVKILDEQRKGAAKIEKKLHELRENLITEMFKRTSVTKEQTGRPPMFKSLQLSTVSKLIDVPVNELMLYFLNSVKASNNHHLVEYHIGHVYFYGN